MSSGSWFQRRGAAIEKALSPFVFKHERGTAKKALGHRSFVARYSSVQFYKLFVS